MSLLELKNKVKRKPRKTVGRGNGSGHGTFSTRGCKGQKARSGGLSKTGFEGGQTPYSRKLPKLKGFRNPNKVKVEILTTSDLNVFSDNEKVTIETLHSKKIIDRKDRLVKLLLGKKPLEKALEIEVHKASKSAIKEVEARKGKVILL